MGTCCRSWCGHGSILDYSDKKDGIIFGKRHVLEERHTGRYMPRRGMYHDRTEEENWYFMGKGWSWEGDKEHSGRTED